MKKILITGGIIVASATAMHAQQTAKTDKAKTETIVKSSAERQDNTASTNLRTKSAERAVIKRDEKAEISETSVIQPAEAVKPAETAKQASSKKLEAL